MATIKDIARLAGVSHGTVSNVLNSRGNVSVVKIDAVIAAAKQLGYRANTQAKLLRAGSSKAIALVVPDIASERYHLLYNGLNRCLLEQGYTLDLFSTYDREEIEKKQLKYLATREYTGVVTVSTLKDAAYYYQKLSISSEKILFAYRRPKNAEHFFDVNSTEAMDKLIKQLKEKHYKSVAVFTDQPPCSTTVSLNQQLQAALPAHSLHFVSSTYAERYKATFDLLSKAKPEAVICSDFEKVRQVKNAFCLGSEENPPPIYALAGEELRLETGLFTYAMNYQALGNKIALYLTQHPEHHAVPEPAINDKYRHICLPGRANRQSEISLLTIPSPSTDALEKLLPHFYRLTGIKVNITRKPFNQLATFAENEQMLPTYDLLRIDMATSPILAEKFFIPLADLSPDIPELLEQFPTHLAQRYSEINGVPRAIPLDPSIQMLFYRRDLFSDQKIRRIYFEKFRQEMTLPENFEQYDRLSAFFNDLRLKGETRVYGSSATIGGSETIASEFMLRYYAKGGKLLHKNKPPRLDFQPATEVLHAYLNSLNFNLRMHSNWWQDAVTSFDRGETAMLIVYSNLFSEVAYGEMAPLIGYATVPGGIPLLGGGSIGVSKGSENKTQAATFLRWLFSPTIVEQMVLLGGTSASTVQYRNPEIKEALPWLQLARSSSLKGIRESYTPDGDFFDLKQAERMIGDTIFAATSGSISIDETICHINDQLNKLDFQGHN